MIQVNVCPIPLTLFTKSSDKATKDKPFICLNSQDYLFSAKLSLGHTLFSSRIFIIIPTHVHELKQN